MSSLNNNTSDHSESRRLSRNSSAGSNSLVPPTRLGSATTSSSTFSQPSVTSSVATRLTSNRSRHDPGNDSLRPPNIRSSLTYVDNDIYSPPSSFRSNGFKEDEVPPPPAMKVSPSEYQTRFLRDDNEAQPPTKRAVATRLPPVPRKPQDSTSKLDPMTSNDLRASMTNSHRSLTSRSRRQRQSEEEVLSNSYSMMSDSSSLVSDSPPVSSPRDLDNCPVMAPTLSPDGSSGDMSKPQPVMALAVSPASSMSDLQATSTIDRDDGPVLAPTLSPASSSGVVSTSQSGGIASSNDVTDGSPLERNVGVVVSKRDIPSKVAVDVSVSDTAGERTNERGSEELQQQQENDTQDETSSMQNGSHHDDLDEKHNYSAPPLASAVDEHGQAYPGAYNAPGRAFGSFPIWGRAVALPVTNVPNAPTPQVSGHLASEDGVAVIVQESPPYGFAQESPPVVAEPAVYSAGDPKPWWRKKSILLCIAILVVVAVGLGVAIPLVFLGSDSESDEVVITAVAQLDSRPEEFGWSLVCGSETIFNAPAGTYQGRQGDIVTRKAEVEVGEECTLSVVDSGGDGIDGGFIGIFFGTNIGNEAALLREITGDYGSEATFTFVVPAEPPTNRPTLSPLTQEPVGPQPSLSPVAQEPVGAQPTPFPTVQGPIGAPPTPIPSSVTQVPVPPTEMPPTPPPPPSTDIVNVTIRIRFDNDREETGLSFRCNDGTNVNFPPSSFGIDSRPVIAQVFPVAGGSQCIFTILDDGGDGICCEHGDGFFRISLNRVLIAEGGEFGGEQTVQFVATPELVEAPSELIPVTVEIDLDLFPDENRLNLKCGDISTKALNFVRGRSNFSRTRIFVEKGTDCHFVIEDDGGNGICCGFANGFIDGSYRILLGDGDFAVAEGGVMGGKEEVNFTAVVPGLREFVEVTVQVRLDDFPEETSWMLMCEDASVVSSEFSFPISEKTRESIIQVQEGTDCQFVIFDTGGNGLCCRSFSEDGLVRIRVNGELIMRTVGDFGDEWRAEFEADD